MNIGRREFFERAGQASAVGAMLGLGLAAAQKRDTYQPAGLIVAGSIAAMRVDYVTLNGARVDGVTECNDVEGWLRCYQWDGEPYARGTLPRTAYLTGGVRVHWRSEP